MTKLDGPGIWGIIICVYFALFESFQPVGKHTVVAEATMHDATCSSGVVTIHTAVEGADWSSVSCPRTLWHVNCSMTTLPPEAQPPLKDWAGGGDLRRVKITQTERLWEIFGLTCSPPPSSKHQMRGYILWQGCSSLSWRINAKENWRCSDSMWESNALRIPLLHWGKTL